MGISLEKIIEKLNIKNFQDIRPSDSETFKTLFGFQGYFWCWIMEIS